MNQRADNSDRAWGTAFPPHVDKQANELIRSALTGLKFGRVQLIVQDGFIIQVERSERHRTKEPKASRE